MHMIWDSVNMGFHVKHRAQGLTTGSNRLAMWALAKGLEVLLNYVYSLGCEYRYALLAPPLEYIRLYITSLL
jgi:hypothetical protein